MQGPTGVASGNGRPASSKALPVALPWEAAPGLRFNAFSRPEPTFTSVMRARNQTKVGAANQHSRSAARTVPPAGSSASSTPAAHENRVEASRDEGGAQIA
jgi:hypothetical protein